MSSFGLRMHQNLFLLVLTQIPGFEGVHSRKGMRRRGERKMQRRKK